MVTQSEPEKRLLAGATWARGEPEFVFDAVAPEPPGRERVLVRGWTGTLSRLQRRLCVGRFNLGAGGSMPCPDRATTPPEYNECFACRSHNGFNPAFDRVDPSQLSPQQRRYNRRPHAVYLAHFGGGLIKVGISSVGRVRTRLLEQGARAAVLLAVADSAWDARRIEVATHERGLPEVVHDATKRRILADPFDPRRAASALEKAAVELRGVLGVADPAPSPVDLTDLHAVAAPLRLPLVDLTDQTPFRISGRAVGLIGKVLIVEQRGLHYGVSLTRVIGHVVARSSAVAPNPMPAGAGQLSLLG